MNPENALVTEIRLWQARYGEKIDKIDTRLDEVVERVGKLELWRAMRDGQLMLVMAVAALAGAAVSFIVTLAMAYFHK